MLENSFGFDFHQLLLLWFVVLLAAILRAFTGFGFSLAAVPGFSLLLVPTQSAVLSTALVFIISLIALPNYWGIVPIRPMLPIMVLMLVGTAIGTAILAIVSPPQFQLGVGIIVLIACLFLAFIQPSSKSPKPFWAWLAGLFAGLMNGAVAIGGPPMIIYAMMTQSDPKHSRAWLMTILGFAAAIALVAFGIAGFVDQSTLLLVLLAFPALYLGNYLGTNLFKRFGNNLYRRIAISVLVMIGLSLVLRVAL